MTTEVNLYVNLKIMRHFLYHRGSSIILYCLHHIGESHQGELRRLVGSQKSTEQAIEWLLRMKMIQLRKVTKEDDARFIGYYSLTPEGVKVAHSVSDCMQTVIDIYQAVPAHKH
jgi:predicted transcriptional regulator